MEHELLTAIFKFNSNLNSLGGTSIYSRRHGSAHWCQLKLKVSKRCISKNINNDVLRDTSWQENVQREQETQTCGNKNKYR
ncbi:hypothetical protein, partial [Tolypothrix sp. FACHB-123]|uniref:hypothetical protein n=1 Tax=Tolypothrix sp. FACHB-123 TaxID=2692868 RepID=UPI001A7EA83E